MFYTLFQIRKHHVRPNQRQYRSHHKLRLREQRRNCQPPHCGPLRHRHSATREQDGQTCSPKTRLYYTSSTTTLRRAGQRRKCHIHQSRGSVGAECPWYWTAVPGPARGRPAADARVPRRRLLAPRVSHRLPASSARVRKMSHLRAETVDGTDLGATTSSLYLTRERSLGRALPVRLQLPPRRQHVPRHTTSRLATAHV